MIELKNVTKMYGHTTIIQNANYVFPDKGFVCLLGPSGCGKTTLMSLIAGLDTDYTGNIIVDHVELNALSENDLCNYRKDYVGFIFQDYLLLNKYTVLENIVYPCALTSNDSNNDIQTTKELLKKIGLSEKANEKVQNLSGGQKQRVAIARALIKNPNVLLADEPTGALDRKTSTEIMEILKEISKTKLVIVITHDHHICDFADEIITIQDKKINIQKEAKEVERVSLKTMKLFPPIRPNQIKLAYKNFKTSFTKYFLVSLIFSIGILCMMFSLSSRNIMDASIADFKEKNIAFNNGYIKNNGNDKVYQKLKKDKRLEHIYKQYKIEGVSLFMSDRLLNIPEKYPMPKTKESMSYGNMPRKSKKEIALSPSLAKKFNSKIVDLIGKKITLEYNHKKYTLVVSGIFNAGYDDFFVSSDIERTFYQGLENEDYYSISYDVTDFADIVIMSNELSKAHIASENASEQVANMLQTFSKVQRLFLVISGMILCVAMFIIVIILLKMQASRYKLVGLLYSFGFTRHMVLNVIVAENVMLTAFVACITSLLLITVRLVSQLYSIPISLSLYECIMAIMISSCLILFIHAIINRKLIHTRPSVALRK